MYWIESPLIVLIIFGTIYKLFDLFVRREERLLLIKKIEEVKNVNLSGLNLNIRSGGRFLALRCGMLALGVGLGLFVGHFFTIAFQGAWIHDGINRYMDYSDFSSVFQTSCVCFFGGLMLVISYVIERMTERKDSKKDTKTGTEARRTGTHCYVLLR